MSKINNVAIFILILLLVIKPGHCFETQAQYAILVDYDTGQILYQKNAHDKMHPSSMTKIMTAYIAFDYLKQGKLSMQEKLKVSKRARYMEGSRMFLEQNSKVSVEDLLKGLIVQSGNDASVVLAERIAGSVEKFAALMNHYARDLGMKNTHFCDACGMPDDNHLSTAYDLYLLSSALIRNFDEHYYLFSIREFEHNNIKQRSWNSAVGSIGIDGIKTGFTSAGGKGVALSAQNHEGRRLVAVLNGYKKNQERHDGSIEIMQHGFDDFEFIECVSRDESKPISKMEIAYGVDSHVELIPQQSIGLYIDFESKDLIKLELHHDSLMKAPIAKGQVIGEVRVIDADGKLLEKTALVASQSVEKLGFFGRIAYNIKRIFSRFL